MFGVVVFGFFFLVVLWGLFVLWVSCGFFSVERLIWIQENVIDLSAHGIDFSST